MKIDIQNIWKHAFFRAISRTHVYRLLRYVGEIPESLHFLLLRTYILLFFSEN